MKTCPMCAEEIQDAALKCRHCGEMLNKPPKPAPAPANPNAVKCKTCGKLVVVSPGKVGCPACKRDVFATPSKPMSTAKKASMGCGGLLVFILLLAWAQSKPGNPNAPMTASEARQFGQSTGAAAIDNYAKTNSVFSLTESQAQAMLESVAQKKRAEIAKTDGGDAADAYVAGFEDGAMKEYHKLRQ